MIEFGECRITNLNACGYTRQILRGQLARLWRYAVVICGDKDVAEQLIQKTCELVLQNAERMAEVADTSLLLFATLHRLWTEEAERKTPTHEVSFPTLGSIAPCGAARRNTTTDLLCAFDDLPHHLKPALLLAYVEGFAYGETAEILRISEREVLRRLADARVFIASRMPQMRPVETKTGFIASGH